MRGKEKSYSLTCTSPGKVVLPQKKTQGQKKYFELQKIRKGEGSVLGGKFLGESRSQTAKREGPDITLGRWRGHHVAVRGGKKHANEKKRERSKKERKHGTRKKPPCDAIRTIFNKKGATRNRKKKKGGKLAASNKGGGGKKEKVPGGAPPEIAGDPFSGGEKGGTSRRHSVKKVRQKGGGTGFQLDRGKRKKTEAPRRAKKSQGLGNQLQGRGGCHEGKRVGMSVKSASNRGGKSSHTCGRKKRRDDPGRERTTNLRSGGCFCGRGKKKKKSSSTTSDRKSGGPGVKGNQGTGTLLTMGKEKRGWGKKGRRRLGRERERKSRVTSTEKGKKKDRHYSKFRRERGTRKRTSFSSKKRTQTRP